MIRTAVLSPCGRYRYLLGRIWNELAVATGPRIVLWVMLNPSTADAEVDDATIRRCIGFSKAWGFDGLEVANLFGLRSMDPVALKTADDPVGPENDRHLADAAARAHTIVAAWGANEAAQGIRARAVKSVLSSREHVLCLGRTVKGAPRHPLYVPEAQRLELFASKQAVPA